VNVGKAEEFCLRVGIYCEAKGKAQAQQGKQLAKRHGFPFQCTVYQASAESKEGIRQARMTPRECNELYTEWREQGE
jgi:hypothetical protein